MKFFYALEYWNGFFFSLIAMFNAGIWHVMDSKLIEAARINKQSWATLKLKAERALKEVEQE